MTALPSLGNPAYLGVKVFVGCLILLTSNPHPLGRGYSTLEFAMNIELDEVVVQDVTDDALELAATAAQGGCFAQPCQTVSYTS